MALAGALYQRFNLPGKAAVPVVIDCRFAWQLHLPRLVS